MKERLDEQRVLKHAKQTFLTLQAAFFKAKRKSHFHAERHGCIRLHCICGVVHDSVWPNCIECGKAMQMFHSDAAPGSWWRCPKGHAQKTEPLKRGDRVLGWRAPKGAPLDPAKKHVMYSNGGCDKLKELHRIEAEFDKPYQAFWGQLGGSVPLSWVRKQWYTGTSVDCGRRKK